MTKNSGQRDFKTLILCVIALLILVGVGSLVSIQPTKASFDLASYGLPEFVDDYRILVVHTPANTTCMPPGTKRLTLQAIEPDVKAFLANSQTAIDSVQALIEQGWGISFTGPGTTREESIKIIERWNLGTRAAGGCVKLGGPIDESAITFVPVIPAP